MFKGMTFTLNIPKDKFKHVINSGTNIFPDNCCLKLFCFLLSLWLLYGELFLFFVEKPTQSSEKKIKIDKISFPAISVCLVDGLDTQYLEGNGYGIGNVVAHDYFVGNFLSFRNITKVPFFGWSGVMDMDPMEMMNRAMLVQNRSIISKAKYSVREKGIVYIRGWTILWSSIQNL